MRMLRASFSLISIAVLLACMAGCGAVIAGSAAALGTYVYIDGQTQGNYETDLPTAFAASLNACADLSIPVTRETRETTSGTIEGVLSGDRVHISLDLKAENVIRITVRVGLVGNENASRRIHSAIAMHLPTPRPGN
ncbi:DUF3568 domain-containing protein [Pseudodesulfovibrio piezophilus]|nr:DUF3568 domain-containing protein [Pseudodesulfovibrio piezophilus]